MILFLEGGVKSIEELLVTIHLGVEFGLQI